MAEFPWYPCRNPSCKSDGQPHPNCKCAPPSQAVAKGGEIEHFCSKDNKHQSDCQYFVDGGDVAPDWNSMSTSTPEQSPDWNQLSTEQPTKNTENYGAGNPYGAPNNQTGHPENIMTQQSNDSNPSWDDLSSSPQEAKYGTPGQEAETGFEGTARSLTGGLSDALAVEMRKGASAIGVPDEDLHYIAPDPKDIAARKEENPIAAGVGEAAGILGSLYTGVGAPALISKIGEGAAELSNFGRVGSGIVKGAIDMGLFQGGDELSKAFLGQGDPEHPVASAISNMGASALLGAVTGGVFGFGAKGFEALQDSNIGAKAKQTLAGISMGSHLENLQKQLLAAGHDPELAGPMLEAEMKKAIPGFPGLAPFKTGIDFYNKGIQQTIKSGVDAATEIGAGAISTHLGAGPWLGYKVAQQFEPYIEKIIGKPITKASQYIIPAVCRMLSTGETEGMGQTLNYVEQAGKGDKSIYTGIENLFKTGGQQAVEAYSDDKQREKLKQFIEQGGITQQIQNQLNHHPVQDNFAEGGEVHVPQNPEVENIKGGLQVHMPEQNMMLNAAKSRVYNYLNSLRPSNIPSGLPFDEKTQDKEKERTYNRALDLANKPLGILNHIKAGTIEPEHIKHLNSMYPEVYNHLSKKLTEKIGENQLEESKPSYKVRQGLSMFLGTPLDSTMTPSSIQSAQGVFNQGSQQPPNPPVTKSKKNTSKLDKVADQYRTADQAAQTRQQGGHS